MSHSTVEVAGMGMFTMPTQGIYVSMSANETSKKDAQMVSTAFVYRS
jgi:hypothetical protein